MTDKIEGTRLHGYDGTLLIHVRVLLPKVLDKIVLKLGVDLPVCDIVMSLYEFTELLCTITSFTWSRPHKLADTLVMVVSVFTALIFQRSCCA